MRTGILGGTFDPIHVAHLHTAECALHQLDLDRVLLVPAGDPWQKSGRWLTPGHHRLEMCRLAVDGVSGLEVDDREVVRSGPTYTVDTLATFPDDEELFLILGADSAARVDTWHRWEEVAARVTVAVAPRPGVSIPDLDAAVVIDMGLLEVSGTDIRARLAAGRPCRYLVTGPVYDYLTENRLYAGGGEDDMVLSSSDLEDPS